MEIGTKFRILVVTSRDDDPYLSPSRGYPALMALVDAEGRHMERSGAYLKPFGYTREGSEAIPHLAVHSAALASRMSTRS